MDFKIFSFISVILLVRQIHSSKKYQAPDMSPISTRFADLLSSLVKVNVERVETLKNLFKLYDVNEAKNVLRSTPDEENSKLGERDEYSEINQRIGLVSDNKRLCICDDKNTDRDEGFYEDFDVQALSRGNDVNQIFGNDVQSLEADQVILIAVDKQLSTERNSSATSSEGNVSSQDELLHKPFKSPPGRQSRSCISPKRGYEDCKSACKEAYGRACAKYSCREKLYQLLRKECKKNCKKRFKDYEDYDYYDYY